MRHATAEYSGTIHTIDRAACTLSLDGKVFGLSATLMNNVIRHFQMGDRVRVEYRPHNRALLCVVMERGII